MKKFRVNLPLIGNIDTTLYASSRGDAKKIAIHQFESGTLGPQAISEAVQIDEAGIDVEYLSCDEPEVSKPRFEVRCTCTEGPEFDRKVQSIPFDDENYDAWAANMGELDNAEFGVSIYENVWYPEGQHYTQDWVADVTTLELAQQMVKALNGGAA